MKIKFAAGSLTLLLIMVISSCYAQIVENVQTKSEKGKIVIIYDLINNNPDSWVEIKVYASHNSFATPIANVIGDIGKVTPGKGKQLEWFFGKELDDFNGELSFELEPEAIPYLNLQMKSLRRGKINSITWEGGRSQDTLHLELHSPSKTIVWRTASIKNIGSINYKPEDKLVLGKGYELQLTSKDDKVVIPIRIKRKVNRLWIIAPSALIVGASFYLLMSDPDEELPVAPEPPISN